MNAESPSEIDTAKKQSTSVKSLRVVPSYKYSFSNRVFTELAHDLQMSQPERRFELLSRLAQGLTVEEIEKLIGKSPTLELIKAVKVINKDKSNRALIYWVKNIVASGRYVEQAVIDELEEHFFNSTKIKNTSKLFEYLVNMVAQSNSISSRSVCVESTGTHNQFKVTIKGQTKYLIAGMCQIESFIKDEVLGAAFGSHTVLAEQGGIVQGILKKAEKIQIRRNQDLIPDEINKPINELITLIGWYAEIELQNSDNEDGFGVKCWRQCVEHHADKIDRLGLNILFTSGIKNVQLFNEVVTELKKHHLHHKMLEIDNVVDRINPIFELAMTGRWSHIDQLKQLGIDGKFLSLDMRGEIYSTLENNRVEPKYRASLECYLP